MAQNIYEEPSLQKAKKGTAEYEEWLRQYREKRGKKEPDKKPQQKSTAKEVLTPSAIKSKLKSAGISVPSGFQAEGKALSFTSESNRSYNTLSNLSSELERLGWKRVKLDHGGHPDGSNYSTYELFVSPDGETVYQHSLKYNGTYYASFLPTEEKERQNYVNNLSDYLSQNTPFQVYQDNIQEDGSAVIRAYPSNTQYYMDKLEKQGYTRSNEDFGVEFHNKGLGIVVYYDNDKHNFTIKTTKVKPEKIK